MSFLGGAVQAGATVATTAMTNESNEDNVRATNEANERMNAATNASNERSVADTNQANRDIAQATNETNMAINQANIDYQNAYNQQIFEREDTAYQRAARDASAVGINPLTLSQGAASGGQAAAPQMTQGAQAGAAMEPNKYNAHFNQAFQAIAPQIGAIGSFLDDANQLLTGMKQRDILTEQVQRLHNENEFFDENGYYPQQMTDLERMATLLSNVFDGKGKGGEIRDKVDTALTDTIGVDSRDVSSFVKGAVSNSVDSLKDLGKGLGSVPDIVKGAYDNVQQAKSGDKLSALGNQLIDFGKKVGSDFLEFQEKYNPFWKFGKKILNK